MMKSDGLLKVNLSLQQKGFSIIEIIITVLIIAIITILARPSFMDLLTKQRLRNVSEDMYVNLRLAQAEAIKRHVPIYVNAKTGTSWCYGFSDIGSCNCSVSNSCQVNGTERVTHSSDYFSTFTLTTTNFPSTGFNFSSNRGTSSSRGTFSFTQNGLSISLNINDLGYISLCSNTVGGYSGC